MLNNTPKISYIKSYKLSIVVKRTLTVTNYNDFYARTIFMSSRVACVVHVHLIQTLSKHLASVLTLYEWYPVCHLPYFKNPDCECFIYLDCECSTDAVWISVFINVNQGCFVYRDYECLTRVVLYVQITNVLPNYFISRLRIFTWGCLYISIMNA